MVEDEERPASGEPGPGRTSVVLYNGSAEPVYSLVIGIVFIQGAAPRTTEKMLEVRTAARPAAGLPITTVSILPPSGTYRVWIAGTGWTSVMAGRPGVEVAFTDCAGGHWIRRASGVLEELPLEPLEYFKQWKFFGPYELQRPQRLA